MENVVECVNLTHYYGKRLIYENLNFVIRKGSIFGLLGKNGTGKTTTINILNGYLQPTSGHCYIFGEDSQHIKPETKARIGFLMEGHIQYNFMTISQIERFYSSFYPKWKKKAYYDLMDKLEVDPDQKIATMSCGQRSQVALGLILAQDPDLMVLDDYSMGLDAGYRRLFLDYLGAYAKDNDKTIFITSHIIQDLENLVEDIVILDYRSVLLSTTVEDFKTNFKQFMMKVPEGKDLKIKKDDIITNFELLKDKLTVYSFKSQQEVENHLKVLKIPFTDLHQVPMSLEDAFIGLTGKY